ncbi:MAG: glycogen-binding domain-containing protein [Planctomycetes bacterium]|nr:glycogen-binding domain-containing protein [Planctomycetota bacterium]
MSKAIGKKRSPRRFATRAQGARNVFLAGSFNGWDPTATPMESGEGGMWSITLALEPGRYEYKYVVDGEWRCEEACEGSHPGCPHCTPNEFGGKNCVLDVPG